jgi:hypothetical protein
VETWQPTDGSITVEANFDEGTPLISVTNETGFEIEHWGAVIDGDVHVAQETLGSGQSATLRANAAAAGWHGMSFGDVLVEQRQIWDQNGWEVIAPLAYAAQGEFSQSDSFVFGISTATRKEAVVNGDPQMVDGPTVWTTPFSTDGFPKGQRNGQVIGVGDWRHIEASQGNVWIESDRIVMSHDVPSNATELRLQANANFGAIGELEIWNWSALVFDSAEPGQDFDPGTYRSASGEVIVRMNSAPNGEPPYPLAITIEWERTA